MQQPKNAVNSPMARLKNVELKCKALEEELAEIRRILGLKTPLTPQISELQNEIAYHRAVRKKIAGDKTAVKRFLASGGRLPKSFQVSACQEKVKK